MKASLTSTVPKASEVLIDHLGWKYPLSQETWNVMTLKRSGAGNTLFLPPLSWCGCFVWFSVTLYVKHWRFLFCLTFSFTLCILLPSPLSNVLLWQFGGARGIVFLVLLIYLSLCLISLSVPGSIHRVSCALFVGLIWNFCTRVICQILKNRT